MVGANSADYSPVDAVTDSVGGASWPLPGEANRETRLRDVFVDNRHMGFYKDPCNKITAIVNQGVVATTREINANLDARVEAAVGRALAANDEHLQKIVGKALAANDDQLVLDSVNRSYRRQFT